jgi:hypothetical protein
MQTTGSPRTLKLLFTTTAYPVSCELVDLLNELPRLLCAPIPARREEIRKQAAGSEAGPDWGWLRERSKPRAQSSE